MKCLYLAVITLLPFSLAAAISPDQVEFFESRIRPILAQDCYECHSTATKQKGGLNLDHRAAWQAGGDSGPVILPGKPDESLLIQAIRQLDKDLAMPKSGAKLDKATINDFVQWVQMGAPDPRDEPPSPEQLSQDQDWASVLERRKNWWSFQPITDPNPPHTAWSNHPVDQFIEAQREEAGLDPNTEADPHSLLRRLYFALIGLPPTRAQSEAFLQSYETNPSMAFANQVDELLASPHFGERWARHWMDWIRYAESHGSEGDPRIVNAHLYRDYLIRALNDDIPFDQLVREHVAGDQLESPRTNLDLGINEALIGTAHWRMVFHGFAPTDALDEKVRFTDDQINVFSKAFLGLTVSCARCHNHKFDAISQADYYALFGIMGSTRPGRKAIDLPQKQNINREAIDSLKPKILEAMAEDWIAALPTAQERLLAAEGPATKAEKKESLLYPLFALLNNKEPTTTWTELKSSWKSDDQAWREHEGRQYVRRWNLAEESDVGQWFREGTGLSNPPQQAGALSLYGEGDQAVLGIHPGGTYTHLQSSKHGGLLTSPDITLDDDYEIWLRLKGDNQAMSRYVVYNYPRNGTVYPVREMRGDQTRWHWQRYNLDYWNGDDVHIEVTTAADAPLLAKNNSRSWFGIREAVVVKKGTATPPEKPRRYLAPVFAAAASIESIDSQQLVDVYVSAMRKALTAWKGGKISNDQAELLDECRRLGLLPNQLDSLPTAQSLIIQYRVLDEAIPVVTRIPTVAEWTAQDQALFDRGNHKKPLADVPRRFLEAIDASPYKTVLSGRRELAEDLLRDDNPLTRRVIVNRIWHHLFGQGIVNTPDNFGKLGAQPSHSKLLDHLASYFTNRADWSLKRLIRYLITTRTWQLSSEPSATALNADPSNALLSHFSVRRLEAEAIRDALLQTSGRLDRTAYGSPVNGSQPKRSVYVNIIRNRLDPFLNTFDAPIPFSSQGRRHATTVPGQSLTMMNSQFVVETARYWGHHLKEQAESQSHDELINQIWNDAFARPATPQERAQTLAFLETQSEAYGKLTDAVEQERSALAKVTQQLEHLTKTARQRIEPEAESTEPDTAFLKPIAQWLFDEDGQDTIGSLHATLEGKARIEDGALVVNGGRSLARTALLSTDLKEKTLEVWVQLETLNQKGGGAISVQTPGGGVFDAIVYAERQGQRWMAGSDGFRRTKDFNGPAEEAAHKAPIHFALTYAKDGTITGYRNGELYGKAYQSDGPQTFTAGKAEVVFGIRHDRPGNGRMLQGKIHEARLYDRVLSAEEVRAAASKQSHFISQDDLIAALTEEEKTNWKQWKAEQATRTATLAKWEDVAPREGRDEVWTDLALAIFNMKEFIYVR